MFATLNDVNLMKLKAQLGKEKERVKDNQKQNPLVLFTLHNTFAKMPLAAFCSLFSNFKTPLYNLFATV